jgi:hypothetical protein
MRLFLLLPFIILLTSCSTNRDEQDFVAPFYKAFQVLSEDYQTSIEQAQQLPYATVRASFDNGSYALMPLGYLEKQQQKWFSRDKRGFTTSDSRVIQIYNVDSEISKIAPTPLWQQIKLTSIGLNQTFHIPLQIDFLTLKRFGVNVDVVISGEGYENRVLWNHPYRLFRIAETINIPSMKYRYTNYYWKDPRSGFIWESIQKWGPNVPVVHYQVVKPWKNVDLPQS